MAQSVSQQGFELIAAANGVFSTAEMDGLIARCDAEAGDGTLSGGVQQSYRRSKVAWVKQADDTQWLYDRIVTLAKGFNAQFFGFELVNLEKAIQIARYDASVQGGYEWHTDFGKQEQTRKLSISVQLSDAKAYEGGDLEFDVSTEVTKVGRDRGLAIAFPSFVRHRVAPVTAGSRYSLVAWINGPRWR